MSTNDHTAFEARPGSPARKLFYCRDPVVLCDGPTGSGKTRPALEKLFFFADECPNLRGLILRKSKAHTSASVRATWENEVVTPGHPAGVLRQHRYRSPSYLFPNGSSVAVDGMYDGSGYNQAVMGTAWDFVVMDEGTQFSEDDFMRLMGRMDRGGRTTAPYSQLIITTNPDAPSHWLWRAFQAGRLTRIPSRLEDNPVFHDGQDWTEQGRKYLRRLEHYTGSMRQRNRYGLWVRADGMIFDEWDTSVHLVKRSEMPEGWDDWWRIESFDFGYEEPFVYQLWAVDPDGRMYLEREYVAARKTVNRHAEVVNRIRGPYEDKGLIQFSVADHDKEDRATLDEHGISTQSADKPTTGNWVSHLESVKRRLVRADDGYPRLFVLADSLVGKCPVLEAAGKPCGFAEEIAGYAWKPPGEGQPNRERPLQVNDHSMDCARYAVRGVDLWYSGDVERPKPTYEHGSIGWAIGLGDDDDE